MTESVDLSCQGKELIEASRRSGNAPILNGRQHVDRYGPLDGGPRTNGQSGHTRLITVETAGRGISYPTRVACRPFPLDGEDAIRGATSCRGILNSIDLTTVHILTRADSQDGDAFLALGKGLWDHGS